MATCFYNRVLRPRPQHFWTVETQTSTAPPHAWQQCWWQPATMDSKSIGRALSRNHKRVLKVSSVSSPNLSQVLIFLAGTTLFCSPGLKCWLTHTNLLLRPTSGTNITLSVTIYAAKIIFNEYGAYNMTTLTQWAVGFENGFLLWIFLIIFFFKRLARLAMLLIKIWRVRWQISYNIDIYFIMVIGIFNPDLYARVYVCACVCACMCVHVCVCMPLFATDLIDNISLSLSVSLSVCLSVSLSLSLSLSVSLSQDFLFVMGYDLSWPSLPPGETLRPFSPPQPRCYFNF